MNIKLPVKKLSFDFKRPLLMGILNITGDSFYDGGRYPSIEKAVKRALEMEKEGADIIDIGGESSRPGAIPVSAEKELKKVMPILKKLLPKLKIPVSIDTYKPEVAKQCLELGVGIVNDISGLRNEKMAEVIAAYKAAVVIMHMKGTPLNMQKAPEYNNAVKEIKNYLEKKIKFAKKYGIKNIIIDPGIGFGKTVKHNLEIINNLKEFRKLNVPVLIGPSRKSFIGKILGLQAKERLEGTLAAIAIGVYNGADIIRVHDVKESLRALRISLAIKDRKY